MQNIHFNGKNIIETLSALSSSSLSPINMGVISLIKNTLEQSVKYYCHDDVLYYKNMTDGMLDKEIISQCDSFFECNGKTAICFLHIGDNSPSVEKFNDLLGRTEKGFTVVFIQDVSTKKFHLLKTAIYSDENGSSAYSPLLAGKSGDVKLSAKSPQELSAVELSVKNLHDIFSIVMQVTCARNSEYRIFKDPVSGYLYKSSHLYNVGLKDSEISRDTAVHINSIGKIAQSTYPIAKHILELK
jgi:hypothetical protein